MKTLIFLFLILSASGVFRVEARSVFFKNAKVHTLDAHTPKAYGFVVHDGTIIELIKDSHQRPTKTFQETVDLEGKTVIPSFHDNHIHPIDSGVEFAECMLYDAKTPQEVFDLLKGCDRKLSSKTQLLRGSGWYSSVFGSDGPTSEMLDQLNLEHPTVLTSFDGHSYWVDSRIMKLAGVTESTKDRKNGKLSRDSNGHPSGIFFEDAMSLIDNVIPERTQEELITGLKVALKQMLENGITTFKDAYVVEDYLKAYQELERRSELKLDAYLALYADANLSVKKQIKSFKQWRARYSSQHVHITTVKIFLDGTVEDKTAALIEPYSDDHTQIKVQWKISKLNHMVRAADAAGFQVHFHAIGDAAVRAALDAIEYARNKNGERDHRHEIAHIQVIDPKDIPRFHALNVSAVFSPWWAVRDEFVTNFAEPYLGPIRSQYAYVLGSVLRSGGRLAFGSDWSVTSMNPIEGIEIALTRKYLGAADDVPSWLPNERISLEDALRGYTLSSAYAVFNEDAQGSLSKHKRANFVVLSKDLFHIKTSKTSTIQVLKTYKDGELLFSR